MSNTAEKPAAKLKIRCSACHQKLDVTGLPAFSKVECPSCRQEIVIPMRFGGFLLEEAIGAGCTGTVYRAVDLTLDREVAVKIVNDHIKNRPERVELFLAEARKIALLNHPHIIPIYSCGEEAGQPFLVMQYMDGQSLAWKLEKAGEEISYEQALAMFLGVAKGLEAAHQHGILHHNIKPANILVDADKNTKIGDFGLAMAIWEPDATPEKNLETCFTCTRYLSPERLIKGTQDVRGDIFSLGATFYHVLTGRSPFEEGAGIRETVEKRLVKTPVAPNGLRDDIPEVLSDFIMRLLANAPEGRPQSYSEIITALEGMKKNVKPKRILNVKKTPEAGAPRKFTSPANAAAAKVPAATKKRGFPLFWGMLMLLVVMILGVLAAGSAKGSFARWFGRKAVAPVRNESADIVKTNKKFVTSPVAGESTDDAWGAMSPVPAAGEDIGKALETPGTLDGMPAEAPAQVSADDTTAVEEAKPAGSPNQELMDKRPRPADLDFFRVKQKLRDYLKTLPEKDQAQEKERIKEVSVLRDYLVKLMKFVPYDDEEKGVALRSGKILKGSVLANENELAVRPKTGQFSKLKWGDLTFDQYLIFFDFYIDLRLNRADPSTRKGGLAQRRREVGADCFRLALLADWYGKPEKAADYLRQSLEYDPASREKVNRFFPKLPPAASAPPAE